MDEFIRFACPSCGKKLKGLARQAGRVARCACGHAFRVPAADPRAPGLVGADDPQELPPVAARPPRRDDHEEREPRPASRLPWMIGGAALLLALGAATAVVATRSPRPPAGPDEAPAAVAAAPVEPKRPAEPPKPAPDAPKPPTDAPKPTPPTPPAPVPTPPEPKAPPARLDPELQGSWKLSKVYDKYEGGTKSYLSLSSKYVMTVRDTDATVETEIDGKKETTKYTIDSDPSKTPKVYRRTTADGKDVVTGIYAFRDGKLLMCFQRDGTIPEGFVANRDDGKGRRIYEFDRVGAAVAAKPPESAPAKPPEPPKVAPESVAGRDGWKTFTTKKGGVSIEIPPDSTVDEKDGSLTVKLKGGSDTFQLSWPEISDEILKGKTTDQMLDFMRDRLVANLRAPVKSELQAEKKAQLGTHTGREIEIKKTGLDAGGIVITDTVTFFRGRLFLVGKRMYVLYAFGKPEFASSKDTTRFLESLKLAE